MGGVDFIAIGEDAPKLPKFSEKGGILGGEGQDAPFFENECRNSFLAICVTLSIVDFFHSSGKCVYKGRESGIF